jgi:hypothetical protein
VSIGPVYAPALVAFIGFGVGASVGWIPLGPREPYYPPYQHSDAYVRNLNARTMTNVANLGSSGGAPVTQLANYRGATVVPASARAASQPIASHAQPVTPQDLAAARALPGAPVRPMAVTAAARPAPGPAVQPHPPGVVPLRPPVLAHPAPGPAIAPRPAATPGAPAALPPLRAAPLPQVQRPTPVVRPTAPQVQRAAPPPAQRAASPVPRSGPPVQRAGPPPAQHAAPAHPQRACPQGRASC